MNFTAPAGCGSGESRSNSHRAAQRRTCSRLPLGSQSGQRRRADDSALDGSLHAAPDQWEGQFESQTHGAQEGTLIRNKTPMTLLNGMPATFVEVAYGSGFDAKKEYAIVWADGQRGIVLAETTRMGDANDEEAQERPQASNGRCVSALSAVASSVRAKIADEVLAHLRFRPRDAGARR